MVKMAIVILFFIILHILFYYFARCAFQPKRKLTERFYDKLTISKMSSKFRILNFRLKFEFFEFEKIEFESLEFETLEF